jgi:hypothetical protein
MNRRFINTIINKKTDFTLENDKKTLAESFLDSLRGSLLEADTTPERDERLQKHKEHLIDTLKKVAKDGIAKLEEIHSDDECLSDDEFFDPNKPLLATAALHSALESHTFGSPAWDEKEKKSKKEAETDAPTPSQSDMTAPPQPTNGGTSASSASTGSGGSDLDAIKSQIDAL